MAKVIFDYILGDLRLAYGTDLTGLGVDNRVMRWDGADTAQSSNVTIDDTGNVIPVTDDAQDLGESSTPLRWANVYARNLDVLIPNAADTGFTIRAASSQTGNILEIKDSNGTNSSFFDANGALALRAQGDNIRQSLLDATNFQYSVNGTNSILRFQIGVSDTVASGSVSAIEGTLTLSHTANTLSSASGLSSSISLNHSGTGDVTTVTNLNLSTDMSTARTINSVTQVAAQHSSGSAAGSIGAYTAFSSFILVGNETLDEAVHLRINDSNVFGTGGITFHAGIKMAKITNGGSRNRGILLNDDGVGSDVTWGSGFYGNISMYRNATSGYLEIDTDIQGSASGGIHLVQDNQFFHFGAAAGGDCSLGWNNDFIIDPDSGSEGSGEVYIGVTADDRIVFGSHGVTATTVTTTSATAGSQGIILVDDDTAGSAVTISLPAASSSNKRVYTIVKLGATANVIVDGNASETINGSTTQTLTVQYTSITVYCNGSNWIII